MSYHWLMNQLAVNEAMREADEEEGDVAIPVEEEPAVPRTRNRPKREAYTSSVQLGVVSCMILTWRSDES